MKLPTLPAAVFLSLFVLSFSFAPRAQAQVQNLEEIIETPLELTAIPPRLGDDLSLAAEPGQTLQTTVRVRNNTAQTLTIQSLVEDFIIGEDGITPVPVEGSVDSRWSLRQWITVVNPENVVSPQSSATITLLIAVPENALPGGRYAMILHQPVVSDREQNGSLPVAGQAGVKQRVGTLIYLTIPGEVNESATLRNISLPWFSEFGPIPLSFDVDSTSDIHIRPQPRITIKNMFGQEVGRLELAAQNVFPYTMRRFSTEWERVWGFGRYVAVIEVAYGQSGQSLSATVPFWILPVRLILLILFLLALLFAIGKMVQIRLRKVVQGEQDHIRLLEERIEELEHEREK